MDPVGKGLFQERAMSFMTNGSRNHEIVAAISMLCCTFIWVVPIFLLLSSTKQNSPENDKYMRRKQS
jgi:hypothetical protein